MHDLRWCSCPGQALLWRQYLLKRRTLAITVVELLSPIILISLLVSPTGFWLVPCARHVPCMRQHCSRRLDAQVVAYQEVTPDHIPARIYVEETAQGLRNLTAPFKDHPLPLGTGSPFQGNCSDLMASMAAAAASSQEADEGSGFQPSASDIAAVESCLGEVSAGSGGAGSGTASALSGVAVQLLQTFIDSNGCTLPSLSSHVSMAMLHVVMQASPGGAQQMWPPRHGTHTQQRLVKKC